MRKTYTLLLSLISLGALRAQAPANDLCANAQSLAIVDAVGCPGAAVQGTTVNAGTEITAPGCDGVGNIQDVWYTFNTTGFNNPFSLQLSPGTAAHYGVQVFVGGCNGVLVGCYAGSPSIISLPDLVTGTVYTVRVFTNTDLGVPGTFSLCLTGVPFQTDCGRIVADNGGTGANYNIGLFPYQEVFTYCPDNPATQAMNMAFTQFNTRSEDLVRIYNGPDINSPLLGTFSGNLGSALPGPFQSTHPTGCITLRFNYNSFLAAAPGWTANLTCCATPVVSVAPTSNSPVCIGGTLVLDAGSAAGTSFVWTGPNGFTSTEAAPSLSGFTAANAGTYFVSASSGIPGCSSSATPVQVALVAPPSAILASGSVVDLCGTGTVDLTAQAETNVSAISEGFEVFPAAGWAPSGTAVTAATNATYFAEGSRSVRLSHDIDANGQYGMTSSIDLTSVPNPVLRFQHICALEQGWDYGFVDYSLNGGGSWTPLPASTYQGANTSNFTGGNVRFSRNSVAAWQSTFTSSSSTPGAGPATDLWREETFNLSAFATSTNFRLRFRITADASINYFGWLIDNVRLTGFAQPTYTWTSSPVGFTSTQQSPAGVPVNTSTVFTVTASTAAGCAVSANVPVNVLGATPVISGPSAITRCAGVPFDLNGSTIGGQAPFSYVWTNAGTVVGAGQNLIGLILSANATVQLTVTDASGCPQSTEVSITAATPPTVTLAAQAPACVNWEPFALTGGAPAGGTYLVNGVPTTTFNPAIGVGVYTVVYQFTDANGCGGSAQRTLLVDACTGMEDLDRAQVRVFPNPANDLLYVVAEDGAYTLQIVDAAGRVVLAEGMEHRASAERTVPVDGLANGAYSLVLTDAVGRRWSTRVVIAR